MKILIYHLGSLGDVVVALPALHGIRKKYPYATISLLTTSWSTDTRGIDPSVLLEGTCLIDSYIRIPKRDSDFFYSIFLLFVDLRGKAFDIIFYLNEDRSLIRAARDLILFRYIIAPRHLHGLGLFRYRKAKKLSENRYESISEFHARKLSGVVSIDPSSQSSYELRPRVSKDIFDKILKSILGRGQIISICTGTKFPANDWGAENWSLLISLLIDSMPTCKVILLGSSKDRHYFKRLTGISTSNLVNLCGNLTVPESLELIKCSDLYVGHDSGPLHLASISDVPYIGIFSSRNHYGKWMPSVNRHKSKIFYTPVYCAGCELSVCPKGVPAPCIAKVLPNEVHREACKMLAPRRMT